MRSTSKPNRPHVLTIALEDYFHAPAFAKVISKKRWGHFETAFEENARDVLDQLDGASAHATFFVTSWVARKYPAILREVIRRGNEVALAGTRGVSFRHLTRESLREQVAHDKDVLEQHTGHRVLGFRVTDVLLGPENLWALDELAALGFVYDSSLSPFLRRFHREPWRKDIHKNETASGPIWEVPLSSEIVAGAMIPYAGGNYFRQFPRWLIQRFLEAGSRRGDHPLVLYFRLWDFHAKQPRLQTGSVIRDFRHYRNGERMIQMLSETLNRFQFSSIAQHLNLDAMPALASERVSTRMADSVDLTNAGRRRTPISVIVPCFNEAEGISFLKNNLISLRAELDSHFDTEFVLVDDGSSDETWPLLQKQFSADPSTKLIRHQRNRGVSAAIMTGLHNAREIACSIDCDCSYDPTELRPMLHLLGPGVDLVTASPYHPAGAVLNVPGWRLLLSRASSLLYRLVTGCQLHTFTACVRVYRRSATVDLDLSCDGFLGVAELLGKLLLQGKSVVEHPATLEVRIFGQSKMKIARTILGHLRLLWQLTRLRAKSKFHSRQSAPGTPHVRTVRFPMAESVEVEVKKS